MCLVSSSWVSMNLLSRKACVLCTGCPESRIDSARVQNFLKENGWIITKELEEADLILFRACGLTNNQVENSIQVIRRLKAKKKENAKLIVWGCLPKINRKALRTVYNGVTFGENEVEVLDKILEAKKSIEKIVANFCSPGLGLQQARMYDTLKIINYPLFKKYWIAENNSIFKIKVSTGCLDNCSFCAVRKSRGQVHSKSIEEVIAEFQDGLKRGYRYFCLLATDSGAYGRDLGYNLVDLLVELTKEKGDYKIGIRNVNPYHLKRMFEDLRPVFASGKIWYLSSAVESGSNRILKLMRRRYKVQDFIKCFRILNNEYPNIYLTTQIMVGFPTETNKDFQLTKHLINKLKLDLVEVYKFSPNKGTSAAKMVDQIPERIKVSRFRQLYLLTTFQHPLRKLRNIFRS